MRIREVSLCGDGERGSEEISSTAHPTSLFSTPPLAAAHYDAAGPGNTQKLLDIRTSNVSTVFDSTVLALLGDWRATELPEVDQEMKLGGGY